MKKPFFSIIIPVLNEEKYLPNLLSDLSNQSFKDFEVIIVDGKSEDSSVKKALTFQDKLPSLKIITCKTRHVCTQRNEGAKNALSDVFIFSDADNRLPTYFLQGIKYHWEMEQVDILSPFIQPDINTKQNKTIAMAINLYIELNNRIKPRFLLESCVVVSKKCFQSVGGFDATLDYSEGTVFLETAISKGYKIRLIRDPRYTFSFRRLKKYGTAKVASGVIGIQLSELLGIDQKQLNWNKLYPMLGGSVYSTKYKIQKNKISKFIKNIKQILEEINS